jgi:hypothetical protein
LAIRSIGETTNIEPLQDSFATSEGSDMKIMSPEKGEGERDLPVI